MTHSCARCGKRRPSGQATYSRFTRSYYCIDTAACERRMAKLTREGANFDRGFLVAR